MNTVLPRAGLPASRRSNLPTIPSPTTSRRPGSPVWFRFPGLPPRSPLGRRTHFRRVPLGVCRASPLTCRLATTSGRIEFVILRTGRSPPVALHLASRQRSCLQLTGSDLTCARTCTPLVRRACRRTCRRCAALRNSCDGFPGADAPRLPAFAAARLRSSASRGGAQAAHATHKSRTDKWDSPRTACSSAANAIWQHITNSADYQAVAHRQINRPLASSRPVSSRRRFLRRAARACGRFRCALRRW